MLATNAELCHRPGMAKDMGTFAREWFEEVWNQRKEERITEWLAPNCVVHSEGGDINSPGDFIQYFHRPFLSAFPDLHLDVQNVVAGPAEAVVRWTFTGTHANEFLGIPPSGRKLRVSGMSWVRCEGDQFVEAWDSWNMSGLITALRDGTTTANVNVI